MNGLKFEWDENKNKINAQKHKITFKEAQSVFYDYHAVVFDDPDHSSDEERFLIIGVSERERICIVSHCYRKSEEIIRIISARKATKAERQVYEQLL